MIKFTFKWKEFEEDFRKAVVNKLSSEGLFISEQKILDVDYNEEEIIVLYGKPGDCYETKNVIEESCKQDTLTQL